MINNKTEEKDRFTAMLLENVFVIYYCLWEMNNREGGGFVTGTTISHVLQNEPAKP